jgi:hypothetical protein
MKARVSYPLAVSATRERPELRRAPARAGYCGWLTYFARVYSNIYSEQPQEDDQHHYHYSAY